MTQVILSALVALVVVAVGHAIFFTVVARRPSDFRVVRSITINTSPSWVFPLVNTPREWQKWSPWENIDPNLKRTYFDPPSGPGAAYSWSREQGESKMTIKSVEIDRRIDIEIEAPGSMQANTDMLFTFEPEGDATKVTWVMTGQHHFIGKVVDLVFSFEKLYGAYFEQGLAKLKEVAEKGA